MTFVGLQLTVEHSNIRFVLGHPFDPKSRNQLLKWIWILDGQRTRIAARDFSLFTAGHSFDLTPRSLASSSPGKRTAVEWDRCFFLSDMSCFCYSWNVLREVERVFSQVNLFDSKFSVSFIRAGDKCTHCHFCSSSEARRKRNRQCLERKRDRQRHYANARQGPNRYGYWEGAVAICCEAPQADLDGLVCLCLFAVER